MTFPQKSRFLKRPIGWVDCGERFELDFGFGIKIPQYCEWHGERLRYGEEENGELSSSARGA